MDCSDSRTAIGIPSSGKSVCLQCGEPLKFWRRYGRHRFCSEACEELKREARARCLPALLEQPPTAVGAGRICSLQFAIAAPRLLPERGSPRSEAIAWETARPAVLPSAHPAQVLVPRLAISGKLRKLERRTRDRLSKARFAAAC